MAHNTDLNVVDITRREAAQAFVAREQAQRLPLIITILLVFGAWLSLAVLVVSASAFIRAQFLACGVLLVILAALGQYWAQQKTGQNAFVGAVFINQVVLAFLVFGQFLFLFGLATQFRFGLGIIVLACFVLTLGGYRVFKIPANRFVMVCATAVLGLVWLQEKAMLTLNQLETVSIVLLGISIFVFVRRKFAYSPLAYGLLAACVTPLVLGKVSGGAAPEMFGGLNNIMAGLMLCGGYIWFKKGRLTGLDWACMPIILVVAYLTNVGVSAGVGLVFAGAFLYDRKLRYFGLLLLALSLVWLYYNMQTTLLIKAQYLTAAGAMLLFGHWCLRRFYHAK